MSVTLPSVLYLVRCIGEFADLLASPQEALAAVEGGAGPCSERPAMPHAEVRNVLLDSAPINHVSRHGRYDSRIVWKLGWQEIVLCDEIVRKSKRCGKCAKVEVYLTSIYYTRKICPLSLACSKIN